MYLGVILNGTPKKQPRRCRRFTAYFGQNWDNVVAAGRFPVLKVLSFFSQIFIISYMRLKLRSLGLLHPQNMSKPIHHCSYFIKFIFLKKGPSDNLSTNKYLMSRPDVGLLQRNLSWSFTFIILLTRRGVKATLEDGVFVVCLSIILQTWIQLQWISLIDACVTP